MTKKITRPRKKRIEATLAERFWAKVDKNGPNGCWVWIGTITGGYGQIRNDGKTLKSHRVSYELNIGQIPNGMCICHHCDNRACVRPDHFFCGTKKDNYDDMMGKGRGNRPNGVRIGVSKLTESQVCEIRAALGSDTAVGKRFGVSNVTAGLIRRRVTWKHLP